MIHPALALVVWAMIVAVGQTLGPKSLALFVALCVGIALAVAGSRTTRLLRRSRFLLLALVVLFAGFTPGERVFPDLHWLPLTEEGLGLAALHGGRLVAVISLVAVLLERMPTPDLIHGIEVLAAPLRLVGIDPRRLSVRLSLVLGMVAGPAPQHWREWLADHDPAQPVPRVAVAAQPFRSRDAGVAVLIVVLAVGWLAWRG